MKNRATPLPLGEVFDFMRLIWAVDHALGRTSKHMEATLGLTGRQRLVIRIVGRFPGILAGQLAETLHVHPSTLTGILKRLEHRGLLARRPESRDARRAQFALTARGRTLDVSAEGTIEAAVQSALAELPDWKVRAAGEVLSRFAELLEKEIQSDPLPVERTKRNRDIES